MKSSIRISPNILLYLLGLYLAISMLIAILHSGFWADDFTLANRYNQKLGSLEDFQLNQGRFVFNLFYCVNSYIFGTSNSLGYILVSNSFLVLAFIEIFRYFSRSRDGKFKTLFIFLVLASTGIIYPAICWAANFGHNLAIYLTILLFNSIVLTKHEQTFKAVIKSTLIYFLIVLSNPLYVPVGLFFAFHFFEISQDRKSSLVNRVSLVLFRLLPGLIYFFTVAAPKTFATKGYESPSVANIPDNTKYYLNFFPKNFIFSILFFLFCLLALVVFVKCIFLRKIPSVLLFLVASLILFEIMVQHQQHVLNYLILPFILYSYFILEEIFPRDKDLNVYSLILLFFLFCSLLVASHSARVWWMDHNPALKLENLRSEISRNVPPNEQLCIITRLSTSELNLLIGGLAGDSGLLIGPVNASSAVFNSVVPCSADLAVNIVISSTNGADYTVSIPK